jgi:16S rRNA (cytosine967-C5)-methyltransferase
LLQQARGNEAGRFSYPQWWIDELKQAWPEQYEDILAAGNLRPPMTLRVNRRAIDLPGYLRLLGERAIGARQVGAAAVQLERPRPVAELPGFAEGWVSVQDLGAQYAAPLLDLHDGQRVLDACAAPGGKTAHMLETCDVEVLALDRDAARLARVRGTLQRLGLDARMAVADAGDTGQWWDGVAFERILLDAPCTASGVVRRHPDGKWLRRADDMHKLAAGQAQLLRALWRTLAPGGKLLYVTCSVFPAETQAPVHAFLSAHPDALRLPLPGFPAATGQLLPEERHDGFFYALLGKRAAAAAISAGDA